MKRLLRFAFVCLLFMDLVVVRIASAQEPVINGAYTLISEKRVNRTQFDYIYRARITSDSAAIKNVSASVVSASPSTIVIDDVVTFPDLSANETVLSSDTFTIRQDRRTPFSAEALTWTVKYEPVTPSPTITVDTSPSNQVFNLAEVKNIATSINFVHPSGSDPVAIQVTQNVTPATGIRLTPNVNGTGFNPTGDFATTLNQEITPEAPGEYEIQTTATVPLTGATSTSTARVTIVSSDQISLTINTPGSESGALAPNTTSNVKFTVQLHGLASAQVQSVTLRGTNNSDVLSLNDTGQNSDLVAGDGTYSGVLAVNTSGMQPQQCRIYEAVAATSSGSQTSAPYSLCVTAFPIGLQPSNTADVVPDPVSGQPAVANEVLVVFKPGATETAINALAASIGGQVVGTVIDLRLYQIRLNARLSAAQLATLITTLQANPLVEAVEANVIGQATTVVPSDTRFAEQYALKTIRADEAWYIARGNVLIAIVDSGADLTHPDLAGKIIKGTDFVNGGDPDDEHGHGTHVAGIAAAETDNGAGIAGVSWNSKLLIVRSYDNTNSFTGAAAVSGLKSAADNGARIINFSGRALGGKTVLCAAVKYATDKGSMVVAAAGNDGSSTEVYPAACPGALAVGNTTSSDTRNGSSNFGAWVDLAAPGTDILSTVPRSGGCALCSASGYAQLTGTSMSSPLVAGAAAVLLSRESLTNSQVEERLKKTAVELPGLSLGAGRIDLFEAVFNGSFEEDSLALWNKSGTVASFDQLGPLMPQHLKRMGYVSTGPADAQTAGSLRQTFTVQPGITSLPVSFNYAFISEEFPEYVGSQYDDSLKVNLQAPNGTVTELAAETVNASSYSAITGLDFPGGDATVGWTGWKTVTKTVPITAGAGEYQIILEDAGDSIFDTVLLIDHIQFKN